MPGALPLSSIISDYATTTRMLEKANQEARIALLAATMHRSNPVYDNNVGIAFMRSSRRSSTRATRRLSAAASKDYNIKPSTMSMRERNDGIEEHSLLESCRSDSINSSSSDSSGDISCSKRRSSGGGCGGGTDSVTDHIEGGKSSRVHRAPPPSPYTQNIFVDQAIEQDNNQPTFNDSVLGSGAGRVKLIDSPIHNFLRLHHPSNRWYT